MKSILPREIGSEQVPFLQLVIDEWLALFHQGIAINITHLHEILNASVTCFYYFSVV